MITEQIRQFIAGILENDIERIIISNKSDKNSEIRRVEVRKLLLKGRIRYQSSAYTDKQVFQNNLEKDGLLDSISCYFPDKLCQMNIFTTQKEYSLKVTKKGSFLKNVRSLAGDVKNKDEEQACSKANTTAPSWKVEYSGHNRQKNYILKEGMIIPPLVDLGVFTKEGKVAASMYDKFKQINRFVELIDDVLKNDPKEKLRIIDFGCGKSYLTFIIYYYLVVLRGKKAEIVGLDLKKDVIDKCNRTAQKYGYDGLHFELGDINGYKSDKPVDMVVTLHACDTATDYALYNAVSWNAKYILSVPCCQHELNGQLASEELAPMMRYGIIKERMAALATDAIRADMLTACGYKTQLLEFVDMAHSPKNILIRAVKTNISTNKRQEVLRQVEDMCSTLSVSPTIYTLLKG